MIKSVLTPCDLGSGGHAGGGGGGGNIEVLGTIFKERVFICCSTETLRDQLQKSCYTVHNV